VLPSAEVVGSRQKITVFSAGLTARASTPNLACALIKFLASAAVAAVVAKSGSKPVVMK
jgi:hypothetical protein